MCPFLALPFPLRRGLLGQHLIPGPSRQQQPRQRWVAPALSWCLPLPLAALRQPCRAFRAEPGVGTSAACKPTCLSLLLSLLLSPSRPGAAVTLPLLPGDGAIDTGATEAGATATEAAAAAVAVAAAAAAPLSGVAAATGEHSSERPAARLHCRRRWPRPARTLSPLHCLAHVSLCAAACCRSQGAAHRPRPRLPAGRGVCGTRGLYRGTRGG